MMHFLTTCIPDDDEVALFGLSEAASFKARGERASGLMNRVFKHNFTLPFPSGATLAESIKATNIEEIAGDLVE
jgi:hypothetical protein